MKILIIEDNTSLIDLYTDIIIFLSREMNFKIEMINFLQDSNNIEITDNIVYDLVISDWKLENHNADIIINEIKYKKIIIVTGYSNRDDLIQYMQEKHIDEVLIKPIHADELREVIGGIIEG